MSVDLISGVMSAADPAKVLKARGKLAPEQSESAQKNLAGIVSTASRRPEPSSSFSDLIAGVLRSADPAKLALAETRLTEGSDVASKPESDQAKAFQQFEGTLWASALESIIPQPDSLLSGDSSAGEFWRGQQIQFMSQAIAERSVLGVENMFASASSRNEAIPGTNNSHATPGPRRIRAFAFSSGS